MEYHDATRIARLTAITTNLQSKRLVTARQLATQFGVSIRTIYRDIKTLEMAGIPVYTEEGKGFRLVDGYKLPPVMFTESEANALVTAEVLLTKSRDASLIGEYRAAVNKIKAVLGSVTKQKVDLLSERIAVSPALPDARLSDSLTLIQNALTSFRVIQIKYLSVHQNELTERLVEPFALYYSLEESWLLIAFCRSRKDFRMFRLDRIQTMDITDTVFAPHQTTLTEYLNSKQKNFHTPDKPLS